MTQTLPSGNIRYPSDKMPHREELTFARARPGFFASCWYPLLYLASFAIGGLVPIIVVLVGLYKNGYQYPSRYQVYYPLYFWGSVLLALLYMIYLLYSLPMSLGG
ncbi:MULTISPECIES: hypothetical protein [unclassified Rothia (in: high G+C Gram-positive bacteria)]|uniref:hypothetical protein n=1 Tax=unclassified Rothia (in: high G+C Gram-positive bacteria) TaxID=2689056 RepID=UPI001959B53F|nr:MULTISPECIES: hypothetical protein [unclassified Rothia (in: high G+C Gram-positive bacteria)]MBM7051597.1 hypothetical protein [Rothia sp. ZJ1223]QRZ61766.1 hypothetical protein JR346_01080 [Rothia sp. ZJ932]